MSLTLDMRGRYDNTSQANGKPLGGRSFSSDISRISEKGLQPLRNRWDVCETGQLLSSPTSSRALVRIPNQDTGAEDGERQCSNKEPFRGSELQLRH